MMESATSRKVATSPSSGASTDEHTIPLLKQESQLQVPDTNMPTVVCHADWGTSSHKRWISRAYLGSGHYEARAPGLVGDHLMLISRARAEAADTGKRTLRIRFSRWHSRRLCLPNLRYQF